MSTIFSKIVSGEISAYKVAESNDFLAFLDLSPLAKGHVLVIPKRETDYIFDINDDEYMALWVFSKIVAQGIQRVFPCKKIGIAVIGLEVAHAHIHLVPLNNVSDLNFSGPRLSLTNEELTETSEKIRESIINVTADN
ncbi:HIT family protein [Sphingobacterium sp. SRCM116780]|uniref:HIT family protein n=1 Tax=Sphingobacterium sp. SRCM116780 TaxID=2907623 RepID=UPI001F34B019|nr:HIT family protein [Sphingobacterium sp. SRCM116780]UIR56551.1 HIT family protein [Sphingobacterium sp. SRCM116780]